MRISDWSSDVCSSDLSGFRVVRAERFREFLHLLPNGFSYPTTSTMAFFRSAYPVDYMPIQVAKRVGNNSHIRPIKDGIRFLLIIFKIATLYSPLKLFAPVAMAFRSAEHPSELQSLMRISYAAFCLNNKNYI